MQNQNIESSYIEEDEIDLRELWETIKGGKKIIALIMTVIVSITFVYVLSIPNSYKSKAVLIPAESGSQPGQLAGLAAMAGINLGSASMTPDVAFSSLLDNYEFMKKFIVKNNILEYYTKDDFDKNYVFALGFRGIYDFLKSDSKKEKKIDNEGEIFALAKKLKSSFSISADKKSGLISIEYIDKDRTYAPKMVDMFLRDASAYLVDNGLNNIDARLKYFEQEMSLVDGFELRQSLSAIISKILQEKVMMKSKKYYQCDLLSAPYEPYIKDKAKPKRALILIVSFITSMILGIFIVFFLNFIKSSKENA